MTKEKYFSCLDCHQEILSKKEVEECPKCGEKFVVEVNVEFKELFKRRAITV